MKAFSFLSLRGPVAAAFVALSMVAGCAAPADEASGQSTGAIETGAVLSDLKPGSYGSAKGPFVTLLEDGTRIRADVTWSAEPSRIDFGYLDVGFDRTVGTSSFHGVDADGLERCAFTIEQLDKDKVRATSACGRGTLTLQRAH